MEYKFFLVFVDLSFRLQNISVRNMSILEFYIMCKEFLFKYWISPTHYQIIFNIPSLFIFSQLIALFIFHYLPLYSTNETTLQQSNALYIWINTNNNISQTECFCVAQCIIVIVADIIAELKYIFTRKQVFHHMAYTSVNNLCPDQQTYVFARWRLNMFIS